MGKLQGGITRQFLETTVFRKTYQRAIGVVLSVDSRFQYQSESIVEIDQMLFAFYSFHQIGPIAITFGFIADFTIIQQLIVVGYHVQSTQCWNELQCRGFWFVYLLFVSLSLFECFLDFVDGDSSKKE